MLIRGEPQLPKTLDELAPARLLAQLDRLDVATRKVFAGKLVGERRSKRRGRSVEFEDYREYTPGDDPRFIDWNVFGRLDRLVVKLFIEEQDLAVHVLLDASPSMHAGDPSKLAFAQRLAFALSYIALAKQNRLSLTVFGLGDIARLPEMRGRRNVQRAGKFLLDSVRSERTAAGEGARGPGFNDAMRHIARERRGAGVTVLISDLLVPEGPQEGLRYLAAGLGREAGAGDAFDTFAVQVLAPAELDPSIDTAGGLAGDLRLTDIETGAGAEVTVSAQLVKQYKRRLEIYLAEIDSFCAARRIAHVLMQSDASLEDTLLRTLRQRGLLR